MSFIDRQSAGFISFSLKAQNKTSHIQNVINLTLEIKIRGDDNEKLIVELHLAASVSGSWFVNAGSL